MLSYQPNKDASLNRLINTVFVINKSVVNPPKSTAPLNLLTHSVFIVNELGVKIYNLCLDFCLIVKDLGDAMSLCQI